MEKSGSISFALSWWAFILAFLVLCCSSETCNAKDDSTNCTSSCGNIHNISYPFRLKDDPKHCGHILYTLSCENNITVLDLPYSGKYYVMAIDYNNKTIRLLDPGLDNNNCSSMPRNSPSYISEPYTLDDPTTNLPLSTSIFYLRCRNKMNSSLYVDTAPCLNNSATSLIQPKSYSYVKVGPDDLEVGDLEEGCGAEWIALMLLDYSKEYCKASYECIHSALMYGFELRVYWPDELGPSCKGYRSATRRPKCFPHTISAVLDPNLFQFDLQSI
ncbi:hypothetical protein ACFX13_028732 [Malus domestica]